MFSKPFTLVQAVNLKSLLRLLIAAFPLISTIFSNVGYVKVFPCKAVMPELLHKSVSYLSEAELGVKPTVLQSSDTEENHLSPSLLGRKFAYL